MRHSRFTIRAKAFLLPVFIANVLMGLLFPVFFSVDEGMPLGDIHPADCFSVSREVSFRMGKRFSPFGQTNLTRCGHAFRELTVSAFSSPYPRNRGSAPLFRSAHILSLWKPMRTVCIRYLRGTITDIPGRSPSIGWSGRALTSNVFRS